MATNSIVLTYLSVFYWFFNFVSALTTELQLERFEAVDGKGLAEFDLRVRKMNRTTHSLNGTFHFLQDLDEFYEISVSFAYSSLGNNQFNEYPMRVPRKKVCHFIVDEYLRRQYLWINHTNMPQLPKGTTEYCPFPKGTYWMKDVVVDASWVPPVVPTGLWRMTISFWKRSSNPAFQMIVFAKFSKKII